MGKGIRYSDEFKQEVVNRVVVHGYKFVIESNQFKKVFKHSHV